MLTMIRSFRRSGTADVFHGAETAAARKTCPRELWPVARRKLDQRSRVGSLHELAIPPGNRLERLRGDREGQHRIRVSQQYRICFRWENSDAQDVEITDDHP